MFEKKVGKIVDKLSQSPLPSSLLVLECSLVEHWSQNLQVTSEWEIVLSTFFETPMAGCHQPGAATEIRQLQPGWQF